MGRGYFKFKKESDFGGCNEEYKKYFEEDILIDDLSGGEAE